MQRLAERVKELRRITGGSNTCGWCTDAVCFLLYSLVKFQKPDLIIQCGHLWGKSSLVCLEAMTDSVVLEDNPQDGDKIFAAFVNAHTPFTPHPQFVSIDPHSEGVPNWQAGIDLLKSWYSKEWITNRPLFSFEKMTSQEYFAQFDGSGFPYNTMTIIDGDHSPEGCRADLEASARIGASLIFLDDTQWLPHIAEVGRFFAREHGYTWTEFPLYNGVAILTK